MGRPPIVLTPEINTRLCEALRIGASLELAAHYAGISSRTLGRWIKRGEEENNAEFCQFCRSIKKARAELAIGSLLKIEKASQKQWTAAAWKLERLFPHIYGRKACRTGDPVDAAFEMADTQSGYSDDNAID